MAGALVSLRWTRLKSRAAVILAAAVLSGCSLFSGPPPETYALSGPNQISRVPSATSAQILVAAPTALKTLDSERIVVADGSLLSYYPDAQWPDRLPKVYQAKAIEAFEKSKRANAVGRPGEGLSIDYQISTHIRAFEFRTAGNGGTAHVEVAVKIIDDRNGRLVAAKTLTGDAPVYEDNAEAVVAGVDAAMSSVLVQLVRWTLSVI